MEKEEIARGMPSLRTAFETLKDNLREGRMAQAGNALFGTCLQWGDDLSGIYADEGREALSERDPVTRFFVTRFRGMPVAADITDAPNHATFLMAFTAFPYLDALVEELTIGEHAGVDEDGNWLVRRVLAGEDEGAFLRARRSGPGWQFDLMPVYSAKAEALTHFVDNQYGSDFDAFLWRYVADHDLVFDMDQAWRPLTKR
ncbi:MAG: hypothetical protein H7Y60_03750 [Rhodospirillaceae bacterium]|nr:hypothetical protein [Rhodospirillales bacterium]